ncbi:4Fe-4S binding protein [Aquabacterium sp.]|uniref:4Fe-4S binding protein n=1 Tax=Aquabacterium sp. TaxID=1872578 RepID=UPI0035B4966E
MAPSRATDRLQVHRRRWQVGFFALFLLAPALNLFRFDLTETQLWVLGMRWSLGIDALMHGQITPTQAGISLALRGLLPIVVVVAVFLTVAWRYGRLYCGWLCPHFSAVELLNRVLHRAVGKFSLWDKHRVPRRNAQGQLAQPQAAWWPVFVALSALLGFLWAITLLTYLLPPDRVWSHLWHGTLTDGEARFIWIGTGVFTAEFVLARHLFCRFGCAVGLFQSLVWMANPKGMVVAFARERARECKTCDAPVGSACDNACPMRLHPRNIKRMMFSCVQCGQCLSGCDSSQSAQQRTPVLQWQIGLDAVRETLRQKKLEQLDKEPR